MRADAHRGVLRMLLAPEQLALEPEEERPRGRSPAGLLAPEALALEPVVTRPRRRGWLRLLFAPEPLEP